MKQIVDPLEQFEWRGNEVRSENIAHFVERKLRDDDGDRYDRRTGIEDRITRLERFAGNVAEALVAQGVLPAEKIVEMICGWDGRNIKIIDVPDENS